jgi:hypothetical protein
MRHTLRLAALAAALLAPPAAAHGQNPKLAPNAPVDRPVPVATDSARERIYRLIQPYVDSARATWPAARARFLAGLGEKQSLFAVTRLQDAAGHEEQVFVAVDRIQDGRIYGRIWSEIGVVQGYRLGQPYDFPESELVDWVISHPDGSEEGNVVGRFLESYRP